MLKPAFKIILITLWCLLWFVPVWIAYLLKKYALRDLFMRYATRGILKISGIQLTTHGQLAGERPLMLVSNHISYMDIIMLASQAPLCFTPKSEIAKWPFIGYVCKITDCVFVDRRSGKVKDTAAQLHDKLSRGGVVSLFPEATTGGGVHLLPFKSSFFNLAAQEYAGSKLHVQPAAITYTGASNLPMDLRLWHKVAWVGDEDLLPHLWELLALSPIKAELHFLPPVTMESDRKALAANCQLMIEQKIEAVRAKDYAPVSTQRTSSGFGLFSGRSK